MMSIDERIPALTDKELATLRANAERLAATGTPAQQESSARVLPLIQAEEEQRKAAAPPKKKSVRKRASA